MDGILIVDKPIGKTSFDIVRDVRQKYQIKKVGHIGTLDPMASGVLPVLVGNATKLSNILVEHDKEYIAVLKLGKSTDTGDSEGTITETDENYIEKIGELQNSLQIVEKNTFQIAEKNTSQKNIGKIEKTECIRKVLNSFLEDSFQIPPMYSAIKVNGKKLYELAREGKTIEREPRKIKISEIELLEYKEPDEIKFRVVCSKGTYIRVLCEDIAKKMNTVGYMLSLRRTRVGNFRIEDANKFIKIQDIFDIPSINVNEGEYKKIVNGVIIHNEKLQDYTGFCNVYFGDRYIGICDVKNGDCKRKIFISD